MTAASVGKMMVVMVFMIVSGVGVVVLIAVSRVAGLSSAALPDGNEREGAETDEIPNAPYPLFGSGGEISPRNLKLFGGL